jgi:hypothetical protein
MTIRRFAAGALAAVMLAALPMTTAWAAHRAEAETAIAAAKAANEKAAAAGIDTAETAKLIQQAESMLPNRQYTKAIEIATQAKKQDEFSMGQSSKAVEGEVAAEIAKEDAPSEKVKADEAIAAAEWARKKAASVGGEWRDTAEMIKDAEAAVKTGEFDKAIKLATKAKHQGELGYAQAMAEADADFPTYMHPKQ